MPPMLPICMSTMSRSGDSSATNATTSGPEVTARTSMSGPLMTASTSSRSVGASLATRMVCTAGTLSDRPAAPKTRPVPLRRRVGRPPAAARRARGRRRRRAGCGRRGRAPPARPARRTPAPRRSASAFSAARLASRAAKSPADRLGGAASAPTEGGRDPVDHQGGDGDVALGQLLGEEAGLGDGVGPGRGHEHVGRGRVGQELVHRAGPAAEARPPSPRRPGRSRRRPARSRRRPPWRSCAAAPGSPRRRPAATSGSARGAPGRGGSPGTGSAGAGASSRSSALRVGGVSTTTMSNSSESTSS